MIKDCTCKHEAQDSMYGKGRRVMNDTKDRTMVRCTVCGTTHSVSSTRLTEKEKEE